MRIITSSDALQCVLFRLYNKICFPALYQASVHTFMKTNTSAQGILEASLQYQEKDDAKENRQQERQHGKKEQKIGQSDVAF